jgi:hypothetical protein
VCEYCRCEYTGERTYSHTYVPLVVKELRAWSTSLLRGGHSPSGETREGAEAEEEEEEEGRRGVGAVLGGMVRMRESDALAPSSSPVLLGMVGTGARTGTGIGIGRKPLSTSCEVEGKDEDEVTALMSPPLPCTIRSPSPCTTGAGASMIPETTVCCCSLAA